MRAVGMIRALGYICDRSSSMNKHFVFVYGSLRRGAAGAMSVRFPVANFIAEAQVNGSLYNLGDYPGLLLNEADSLVMGEVYEVDDETLSRLDEFEATSHYLRKQVEITHGSNRRVCWTYEPDPEFYSFQTLIESGDWIEFVRTKSVGHGASLYDEIES